MTADDLDRVLARVLRPGQQIVVGQAWATPVALLAALGRHRDLLRGSTVFVGMLLDSPDGLPDLGEARIETFFPSGPLGTATELTRRDVNVSRESLYELAAGFASGRRRVDVVLAHGAVRDGAVSLGLGVDYVVSAAAHAAVTVVETHPAVPWTGPGSVVGSVDDVLLVSSDAPPPVLSRPTSDIDEAIAEQLAPWIPDGATIQLGMAAWIEPLARRLGSRRGLRVHSGLVGDWALDLGEAGALDASMPIVAAGAGGTAGFYDVLGRTDQIRLCGAIETHAPHTLAGLPTLRAVNSAFTVDLAGRVNSESGPAGRRGGVGGLRDFAGAAAASPDGLSIVALAAGRRHSRIVPDLGGPGATLDAESVDVIVTEHGSVDLRGATLTERAALIRAIAAPEHRAALTARVPTPHAETPTRRPSRRDTGPTMLQNVESTIRHTRVDFREVGLREGLQSHGTVLTTEEKVDIFRKLVAAGCRELNPVAFVHPGKMPQMADAEQFLRSLGSMRDGRILSALVPNERGLERAVRLAAEGLLDTIFLVFAESTAALVANGMTPDHEPLLERIDAWSQRAHDGGLTVSVFVSTAYGCSINGPVDPASVVDHAARIAAMAAVDELVISDSTGQADPLQVLSLLTDLAAVVPVERRIGLHFHDTRGAGLSNVFAALLSPFRHVVIDGAFGGWGGDWPMLAEAFGNVATEDVVELLVGLGIDVGIDVEQVAQISRDYAALVDRRIEARVPSASAIGWKRERRDAVAS